MDPLGFKAQDFVTISFASQTEKTEPPSPRLLQIRQSLQVSAARDGQELSYEVPALWSFWSFRGNPKAIGHPSFHLEILGILLPLLVTAEQIE